jgi:hypothetical protein
MRLSMVTRGYVKHGVVVLEEGACLAEGLEVTVFAPDPSEWLAKGQGTHSVLDIPAVNLGTILQPLTSNDDLMEEMLENRRI